MATANRSTAKPATAAKQETIEISAEEAAAFQEWQRKQKEAAEPTRTIAGKIPASVFKDFDRVVKKRSIKKQEAITEAVKDWIAKHS